MQKPATVLVLILPQLPQAGIMTPELYEKRVTARRGPEARSRRDAGAKLNEMSREPAPWPGARLLFARDPSAPRGKERPTQGRGSMSEEDER
jgi:hypothetical protein